MAMASDQNPFLPIGVLLCAVFWILIGTDLLLVYATSESSSVYSTIFLLMGILLVLAGWGLLRLQNWARLTVMTFSILAFLYAILYAFTMVSDLYYGYITPYILLRLALLVLPLIMLWYFIKQKTLFHKRPAETPL